MTRIFLSLLLLGTTLSAAPRGPEDAPPGWPGMRGYYRAQARKAQENQTAAQTQARDNHTDQGGSSSTAPAHANGTGSNATTAPASAGTQTAAPATPPPLNLQAAAQLRAEAHAAARAEASREVRFRWPRGAQRALHWGFQVAAIDGFEIPQNTLRTHHYELVGNILDGFQPLAVENTETHIGLVLVNSVRPAIRVEFFSFPAKGFLPDLEAASIAAYQRNLPSLFGETPIELVESSAAQTTFGPSVADQPTRRVRYRLLSRDTESGSNRAPDLDVADYLIPLEHEWIVARFFAPSALFPSAAEDFESFLQCLETVEPELHTAAQ